MMSCGHLVSTNRRETGLRIAAGAYATTRGQAALCRAPSRRPRAAARVRRCASTRRGLRGRHGAAWLLRRVRARNAKRLVDKRALTIEDLASWAAMIEPPTDAERPVRRTNNVSLRRPSRHDAVNGERHPLASPQWVTSVYDAGLAATAVGGEQPLLARHNQPPTIEVITIGLLRRLLHREQPPHESPCPHCGVPAPPEVLECSACGWDLRESYHDPVSGADHAPVR